MMKLKNKGIEVQYLGLDRCLMGEIVCYMIGEFQFEFMDKFECYYVCVDSDNIMNFQRQQGFWNFLVFSLDIYLVKDFVFME